ncbi:hypothetical protein QK901_07705 [Streptococcus thermophilus]|uniref:hypothetical protein n=1 Tax=Streptococcus thermophilus TaxID=1308 RepID=UPI003A7FA6DD
MVKYSIELKQRVIQDYLSGKGGSYKTNQTKIELDESNSISLELPKQLKNPSISTWIKSLTFGVHIITQFFLYDKSQE